jgi:hypothetical protein
VPFPDQDLQIGFEPGAVVTRVLKEQLDQPPLAGTKVPMNASASQAMQQCDRLLGKQLFKLVGSHVVLLKYEV